MHFGIFIEEKRQALDQASAFREVFSLVEAAEAWGADCVWLGQVHFNPMRSVISASLLVAASIATRTKRLHVGTAIQILPLTHALRIAEEVATVDQISEGRFEFGIGRSGAPRSYDVLGVSYGESQARFHEALDIIRRAWKGEPFSYNGEFHRFENATVSPRPYQVPHPPIRMAATTDETFPMVGTMGLPIFVGLRLADVSDLKVQLGEYRKAWRAAGHPGAPSVYLRVPVYAGTTEKRAVEEPYESITYFFGRQAELARTSVGRAGGGPAARRRAQADRIADLTYEQILTTKVAFGTASGLVARLTALREELGLDGIVVEPNPGGLIPLELERQSLRILAHEVMPALR